MSIEDVIKGYPETASAFARFGLRCRSCCISAFEDIEEGARSHNIDFDTLLNELSCVAHE